MGTKKIVRIIFGGLLMAIFVFCILLFGTNRLASTKQAAGSASPETPESTHTADTEPSAALMSGGTGEAATPTPEPTIEPTPTPEPTPSLPDVDLESWELKLANGQHSIADYTPDLTETENGQYFDSNAVEALEDFMDAAREEGMSVYLSSAYRSFDVQKYLYDLKVSQYGDTIAKTIVAPPGTSEHQLGLAADITDQYYQYKNESLEDTDLFKWMDEHCAEYGFILRYPKDKTEITGVMYEPWHFRYVGTDAAAYIMENGLCLEEFLKLYE